MEIFAPFTGSPLSKEVTQTTELSAPHLKCTAIFVTSAEVGTYIFPFFSKRELPSFSLSISTTKNPGSFKGIPTTSNAFSPFGFGMVKLLVLTSPANIDFSLSAL